MTDGGAKHSGARSPELQSEVSQAAEPRAAERGAEGSGAAEPAAEDRGAEDQLAIQLAADLQRLLLVSSRILRTRTASQDISASQFSVLAYLHRSGGSTPGAIAAFERVSPPVITRMLVRLEQMGLLVRRPHPEDGRQVWVTLTDHGVQAVLAGREERNAWLRERIAAASPAEREEIAAASEVLTRTLLERRDEQRLRPSRRARDRAPR